MVEGRDVFITRELTGLVLQNGSVVYILQSPVQAKPLLCLPSLRRKHREKNSRVQTQGLLGRWLSESPLGVEAGNVQITYCPKARIHPPFLFDRVQPKQVTMPGFFHMDVPDLLLF